MPLFDNHYLNQRWSRLDCIEKYSTEFLSKIYDFCSWESFEIDLVDITAILLLEGGNDCDKHMKYSMEIVINHIGSREPFQYKDHISMYIYFPL